MPGCVPRLVAAALGFFGGLASARASDPGTDAVGTVLDADWNVTFEVWKRARPDADCQAYRGDSYVQDADEMFCHACRTSAGTDVTEWTFYAYGDEDPPHCRLNQVRHSVNGADDLQALEAAVSARLGPAARLDDPCALRQRGCKYFKELRRWERTDLDVTVYRDVQGESPAAVVQGRAPALRAALQTRAELRWNPGFENRIAELVAGELGERSVRFRELLQQDSSTFDLRSEIAALREASRTSDPQRHLLALAADVLAEHLERLYPEVVPELPEGLTFESSPLGAQLDYRHDLAQSVLREAPEGSVAHDLAILATLDQGLDPSDTCQAGADQYRGVVREGEAFLSKRADSKFRQDATFLVAQAYETWWSISQAAQDDDYANAESAHEGAEEARVRAVALYGEVARSEPESVRGRHARFVLPRLKLRVDTNQRRFFCIYD